ncbi:MAG TPA: hypothetical protein VFX16_26185 [Pseudonocardiaceae bacterium]|nr:hypothetical protein [Pseudonocardiaceae bacterium]
MTHPGQAPAGRSEAPEDGQPLDDLPVEHASGESPKPARQGRRQGLIIGVVAAVVVVIAGGIATWVAVSGSGSPGAGSPQDAATHLVSDINNNDLLGVVNDLPPNESALLRSALDDASAQLKQIKAVQPNASSQDATGLSIHATGLKFDTSAVEQVNAHIAITKLVAGTITFGVGLTTNQYTDGFLKAAFPNGTPAGRSTTVDIAKVAQQLGHPVRIATVKDDGRWYPSLFYTIADSMLQSEHKRWPAQTIAPLGADIPNEAAEDWLQAVFNADAKDVIARTSPVEMGALHDMGQALIDQTKVTDAVQITKITFDDRRVTGGVEAVLRNITLTPKNGQPVQIVHTAGCYVMTTGGKQTSLCTGGLASQLRAGPAMKSLPAGLITALDDMFSGLGQNGVGIVTTESAEQWYVNPGRTITQFAHDLEGSLTQQDLISLLQAH